MQIELEMILMGLGVFGAIGGLICLPMVLLALARQAALIDDLKAQQASIWRSNRELKSLFASSIGLGQRILVLEKRVDKYEEKQSKLESRDPQLSTYAQAVKLAQMGTKAEDLVESCGLSMAEAKLMVAVHQQNEPSKSAQVTSIHHETTPTD